MTTATARVGDLRRCWQCRALRPRAAMRWGAVRGAGPLWHARAVRVLCCPGCLIPPAPPEAVGSRRGGPGSDGAVAFDSLPSAPPPGAAAHLPDATLLLTWERVPYAGMHELLRRVEGLRQRRAIDGYTPAVTTLRAEDTDGRVALRGDVDRLAALAREGELRRWAAAHRLRVTPL